ncbi:MAG: hypothetical protein KDD62_03165 [Bdellovibrionales bacterium]|nr:hypothetical protein [Bdellovibrionales bacterium]
MNQSRQEILMPLHADWKTCCSLLALLTVFLFSVLALIAGPRFSQVLWIPLGWLLYG